MLRIQLQARAPNLLLRRNRTPLSPGLLKIRRCSVSHQPLPARSKVSRGAAESLCVSCRASGDRSDGGWTGNDDGDGDFVEAVVLVAETIRHHHLLGQGFQEETKQQYRGGLSPLSTLSERHNDSVRYMSDGFLLQFKSPTIFLKVSCDEDLLLPIVVGEFAIEKLIETVSEDNRLEYQDQFQFVKNLVGLLGFEVKMVRITENVDNKYYALVYLGKPDEKASINLDARPSDAINLARRCKVPIYVSKQIALADALRLAYIKRGGHVRKPTYDVILDSAPDGPDSLLEELILLEKLTVAIKDECYEDAAMWRDRLAKLRGST